LASRSPTYLQAYLQNLGVEEYHLSRSSCLAWSIKLYYDVPYTPAGDNNTKLIPRKANGNANPREPSHEENYRHQFELISRIYHLTCRALVFID